MEQHVDGSMYLVGTIVYTSVIFVVNLKIAYVEAMYITWVNQCIAIGTMLFWFLYLSVYCQLWSLKNDLGYNMMGVFQQIISHGNLYFIVCLTVTVALIPDIVYLVFQRDLMPTQVDLYRLRERAMRRREEKSTSGPGTDTTHGDPTAIAGASAV